MSTRCSVAALLGRVAIVPMLIAAVPWAPVLAQTFGAQQAVRQRLEGLGSPQDQEFPRESIPETPPTSEYTPATSSPTSTAVDVTFISPRAAAIVVLRPAQIMAAPIAELLPTEVATAAGLQYLGINPADVDELLAFAEMPGPTGLNYGMTFRFNKPFRGSAIPPHLRPSVTLSELAGRKYLQSSHLVLPSYYGTDTQTLIAAPDSTLRQLVETSGQPKTGPLIDRIRQQPTRNDLTVVVDIASLRPMVEMWKATASKQLPPDLQPLLELVNSVTVVEWTLNLSGAGPTSLVLVANDENAAMQVETALLALRGKIQSTAVEGNVESDPVAAAWTRYLERQFTPFAPQRQGTEITCFHIDSQSPNQQLRMAMTIGMVLGQILPMTQGQDLRPSTQTLEEPPATEPTQ